MIAVTEADRAKAVALFESKFPKLVVSEMDYGHFWQSFEEHAEGDTITHEGRTFTVLYSWPWWKPGTRQIFMAELDPAPATPKGEPND